MRGVDIERRGDGSLLLTYAGHARWGVALAAISAGAAVLAALAAGNVTLLGQVVALPLGVVFVLTGLAAIRHRDWMLFDRQAREVAFRRGLASVFRPAGAVPFDEIEAVSVEDARSSGDGFDVELRRTEDLTWHLDTSADRDHVSRLVLALHDVGGWPVLRAGQPLPPPYRLEAAP